MKRILHSFKTGVIKLVETPCPQVKAGHLLIQTGCSLISPGTEKMLIDFGKASLLEKIRQQPDKVKMVLDKIKTDGLLPTLEAVQSKLDQAMPLGYCNVGTVLEVGEGVSEFSVGDRVVSNGSHAEVVLAPKNLCCKVPDVVSDEEAVFAVLGAIALQGIRLANPTLGESFVVVGLGLIGLLTVQLLRAQGCRVLGVDFDEKKLALANQFGAETVNLSEGDDLMVKGHQFSRARGVDGVLITASTQSNDPVHQAAQMCRKRGRIILVGVAGLALSRADFYEKELSFQVSCSYGPGRYDACYEEQGHDYPLPFVRWTEQRNFEAVLDLLASRKLTVSPLISHHFAFQQAEQAYALLSEGHPVLGVLLAYVKQKSYQQTILINPSSKKETAVCIGLIGAGNYASRVLIPAFKKANVAFKVIACGNGISGTQVGKKFGFEKTTTKIEDVLSDPDVNTVVIATRHNSHADLVSEALQSNKHVFVEKPLCLTFQELDKLQQIMRGTSQKIMVGFNRRFSPHIQKIKALLKNVSEPKFFIMTVNAGQIPLTHWTQNPAIGGGRLIGEACHFIDLLRFLAGSPIVYSQATKMNGDTASITLSFEEGSLGVIHYLANGHKAFPKERLEIFSAGRILQLDNFCKLRGYGWPLFKKMNLWRQDKGQVNCISQFVNAITQGLPSPIPVEELIETSSVTLEVAENKNHFKLETHEFSFSPDKKLTGVFY